MSGFYPSVFVNIQNSRHCLVTGKMNILMSLRCGGTHVSQKYKKKYIHIMEICLSLVRLSSNERTVLVVLE